MLKMNVANPRKLMDSATLPNELSVDFHRAHHANYPLQTPAGVHCPALQQAWVFHGKLSYYHTKQNSSK